MLLSSVTDGLGHGVTINYDGARRVANTIDALNRETQQNYDPDGHPATTTTPLNFATTTLYDAKGFKQAVTDAENHTWDYTYDKDGRPATLSNRLNKTFAWTYDDSNRTVTLKTPLQRTTVTASNTRGLPQSIAKPSDAPTAPSITFDTYDSEGRLTQKTDGVGVTTYTYYASGLLHTVAEGGHTTTRVYDALDRLTQYSDGEGNTIGYDYTAAGRLWHLTYPGGRQVTYAYDDLGRVHTVTDWANRITTYTYDNASRLTRIDHPNGTYRIRAYNDVNELTGITDYQSNGTIFYYENLGHDNDSRITSMSRYPKFTPVALSQDSLQYDSDNELSTWNGQTVTFDSNGNMTNGPLPSGTMAGYSYDARNRLTSASGSSYRYNPDGVRVEITGTGAATFVVDPNATLSSVLERTKGGVTTYYIYGLGLLYEDSNGAARQYHFDHVGTTIAITDSSQNVTDRWTYSSFGAVATRTGSTDTPFQFNGEVGVQDDATGLLYMRARYYNPRIMRFLNADPIEFVGGLNWYAFSGNNPLSFADPMGLCVTSADIVAQIEALGQQANQLDQSRSWFSRLFGSNPYRAQAQQLIQMLNAVGTGIGAYNATAAPGAQINPATFNFASADTAQLQRIGLSAQQIALVVATLGASEISTPAVSSSVVMTTNLSEAGVTVVGDTAYVSVKYAAKPLTQVVNAATQAATKAGARTAVVNTGIIADPALAKALAGRAASGETFLGGTVRSVGTATAPQYTITVPVPH